MAKTIFHGIFLHAWQEKTLADKAFVCSVVRRHGIFTGDHMQEYSVRVDSSVTANSHIVSIMYAASGFSQYFIKG